MKQSTVLTLLALLFVTGLQAMTGGLVKLKCPLDHTEFEAFQNFSGSSFGARLDLKKIGAIAQPWALAQCPKCGFPLYLKNDDFSADELKQLKSTVEGERFKNDSKGKTAYYALAIILEELKKPPMDIAWVYLEASWEVEEKNPAAYKETTRQTIKWFDIAAKENKEKNPENYCLAQFLAIELERRNANFDEAKRRLESFDAAKNSEIEWLAEALNYEKLLVTKKDKDEHALGDWEK